MKMMEEVEAAADFILQLISSPNSSLNGSGGGGGMTETQRQLFKEKLVQLFCERFRVSTIVLIVVWQMFGREKINGNSPMLFDSTGPLVSGPP